VWIDTVKRGPMLRQVRGSGTLVPEEVKWIPAAVEGRVEQIFIRPGTVVTADTVVLSLSNPQLDLETRDAALQLKGAEADFADQKAKLAAQRMDQEASVANVKSQYTEAQLRADADDQLAKDGLVADINRKISRAKADEMSTRYEIEKRRFDVNADSQKAQIDAQQARVDQSRALYDLKKSQLDGLKVRAGADGVLQQLPVEVGQRVTVGTTLAKVARPDKLKAELRIAETQAKDILVGQSVSVDTRNGLVPGRVSRIDPAVESGTVRVDVMLEGALPKGARPDLTVDGTIELERLTDVLYVGRPAAGQEQGTISLFRIQPDGEHAARVNVKLGRASVNAVEILDGLHEGDRVVLSDMSAWDAFNEIRLND
jgi:HlyD family secretion protein